MTSELATRLEFLHRNHGYVATRVGDPSSSQRTGGGGGEAKAR